MVSVAPRWAKAPCLVGMSTADGRPSLAAFTRRGIHAGCSEVGTLWQARQTRLGGEGLRGRLCPTLPSLPEFLASLSARLPHAQVRSRDL